jgi:hypothetical protein
MRTSTKAGCQSRLDLPQVGRCVRGVQDVDDCEVHTQTTQHYCRVCDDTAYSGGMQGGQTAERVDAKTVVVGTTDEL